MITENLSTLKIHKLTQAQYDRELEAGRIDENALYLTPDDANIELDTTLSVEGKAADAKAVGDTLALKADIKDTIKPPVTAAIGQTIVVKSVDANGKPTEWEAVDMPSDSTSNTEFILNSSTERSTKQFKITIDDTGTLIISEIVAGEAE